MFLSDEDTESIRRLVERDVAAVRQADLDLLAELFAEDAIRLPPGQAPIVGRDSIRHSLQEFPPVRQFDVEIEEIDGRHDLAFVRASYAIVIDIADAESVHEAGSLLAVLKKRRDGSWVWHRDMWHSGSEAGTDAG